MSEKKMIEILRPNKILTYGRIWRLHMKFQEQIRNDSACAYTNADEINNFYNAHETRIQSMATDMKKIQDKYYETDENGMPKFEIVANQKNFKLKEGLTQVGFNVEMSEIVKREVLMKV